VFEPTFVFIMRNMGHQVAYIDMYIYCVINSVARYMFRPPIVGIYKEVFFVGYITYKVKII